MIHALFHILDVLEKLLYFGHTHLFLHFFNKLFLQVYDCCVFVIFAKVNVFKQSWGDELLMFFTEVNFFLQNFEQ